MDKLLIEGGNPLQGEITVSGAKNASLPLLAATLLFDHPIKFSNIPKLSDINFFKKILSSLGAQIDTYESSVSIDCSDLTSTKAEYEYVRKMRASVLVLGPILSRFGKAEVSLPGGCAIGTRPVDLHIKGLEAMGAKIELKGGYIYATAPEGLKGVEFSLDFPSVGATENLIMAACNAEGITKLNNIAREPEIDCLIHFLVSQGFEITQPTPSSVEVKGKSNIGKERSNDEFLVIGDRIEAATFVIAALMCPGSNLTVKGFNPEHIHAVLDTLAKMGAKFETSKDSISVKYSGTLKGSSVDTAPYPGFPTDVQAQIMSLMGISDGVSVVSEHIFENRFMHVPELIRMGQEIKLEGHVAKIKGITKLNSAPVMCTDLRASAALLLAGLVAEGKTEVLRVYHLDRGYETIEKKLNKVGANITRLKE